MPRRSLTPSCSSANSLSIPHHQLLGTCPTNRVSDKAATSRVSQSSSMTSDGGSSTPGGSSSWTWSPSRSDAAGPGWSQASETWPSSPWPGTLVGGSTKATPSQGGVSDTSCRTQVGPGQTSGATRRSAWPNVYLSTCFTGERSDSQKGSQIEVDPESIAARVASACLEDEGPKDKSAGNTIEDRSDAEVDVLLRMAGIDPCSSCADDQ